MSDEERLYMDPTVPVEDRVEDLLSQMTVKEKALQMINDAPAIERLGVPAYDWWNEALHGVGRAGIATVFPQAIGIAATWNEALMWQVANVISDEARAKHHEALRQGDRSRYTGLTYWSPNINIFRDPRWGRGQETYGEDPYLTSRLGVAFVLGLQGENENYFKVIATPKHYAVHSGPEHDRHQFDAIASVRDMRETYLPAFEATIREGGAYSIMGAYNRTNGEACCASPTLLQEVLRDEWGFEGFVVSDCGAIGDIYQHHKLVETAAEAAALAVKNGCDLNCGATYVALTDAVEQGLITEEEMDVSLRRLFTARFLLGMFDPPEQVPFAQIPFEINDCAAHRELALETARQSMVLLKNDGVLPLDPAVATRVAVVGPNANDAEVLLGNYNGTPSSSVTPYQGIRDFLGEGATVTYAQGASIVDDDDSGLAEAVALAEEADVVVAVVGISQAIEGEEGQREGVGGGRSKGDRVELGLPGAQEALLKALHATGKPLVVVLMNGSALAINWAQANAAAILEAWYPGEEGGTAIAETLFGAYNPGGRLPVTFYQSADDLPSFTDYNMEGKTYRYFQGEPLYPFGFGLSYTRFAYSDLQVVPGTVQAGQWLKVSARVTNVGNRAGDEVVQCYISDLAASWSVPIRNLQGFDRVHLAPGESKLVTLTILPKQLSVVDDDGWRVVEPGMFQVSVGGMQPGYDQRLGGCTQVLTTQFEVVGEITEVE